MSSELVVSCLGSSLTSICSDFSSSIGVVIGSSVFSVVAFSYVIGGMLFSTFTSSSSLGEGVSLLTAVSSPTAVSLYLNSISSVPFEKVPTPSIVKGLFSSNSFRIACTV